MITFLILRDAPTAYCRLCRQKKELQYMIVKGATYICYPCERMFQLDDSGRVQND